MKNLTVFTIAILTLVNCVDENPQLDSEKYKAMQITYEEDKNSLNENENAFFLTNKDAVEEKINLIKGLKDSLREFKEVPSDSNFILESELLRNLNFSSLSYSRNQNRETKASNAIFLNKDGFESTAYIREPYFKLYNFDFGDTSINQFGIPEVTLNDFLEIKYVFILSGFTLAEPSIEDNSNFNSGLFFGSVVVYDTENKKALYQYTYIAESSEQINYMEGYGQNGITAIKNDFTNNITKALVKETKSHFNFL